MVHSVFLRTMLSPDFAESCGQNYIACGVCILCFVYGEKKGGKSNSLIAVHNKYSIRVLYSLLIFILLFVLVH